MDSFNAQSSGFIAAVCPPPPAPGRSARVVLSAVENALLQDFTTTHTYTCMRNH